jgi:hypothetical protein
VVRRRQLPLVLALHLLLLTVLQGLPLLREHHKAGHPSHLLTQQQQQQQQQMAAGVAGCVSAPQAVAAHTSAQSLLHTELAGIRLQLLLHWPQQQQQQQLAAQQLCGQRQLHQASGHILLLATAQQPVAAVLHLLTLQVQRQIHRLQLQATQQDTATQQQQQQQHGLIQMP